MRFPRSSGILLHISSLPSPYGIGDMGQSARDFIGFLSAAGQKIWQILPLCPPANGNSPYSSYSAFAGNPILISPEDMINDCWARQEDLDAIRQTTNPSHSDPSKVDFDYAAQLREIFFKKSFEHSAERLNADPRFEEFQEANEYWLRDYATFVSLSQEMGEFDWTTWPNGLSDPNSEAVKQFVEEHSSEIQYTKFLQFVFDQQWNRLRKSCEESGISIYGDLPIFVDHQSADVWANPSIFQLDQNGTPEFVAGVPPDYFSPTGQKWGNPLYRWTEMEKDNFRWWVSRFRRSMEQFDIIRVDHFRGFEAYWEIPGDAPSAKTGQWVKGPNEKPFEAAQQELGQLPIVAEDLGLITKEVNELRERLGFPSMRVIQFGYSSEKDNFHRPEQYPENCFAYTGTHDNETIVGWYQDQMKSGSEETRNLLVQQFPESESESIQFQLIKSVLQSNADCAIIPM